MALLRVPAFAKLNLALDLLGPRPDGYTEIATVFQTIDLADDIALSWEPDGPRRVELDVVGDAPCPPEENLAWRAAEMYLRESHSTATVRISLTKRVPTGAGLGGGSADAAAVLWGLDRIARHPLGADRLCRVGAQLGADVPFLLHGGLAVGRGRGDALELIADRPRWVAVVAKGRASLNTADVYALARRGLTPSPNAPNISRLLTHLRESRAGLPPVENALYQAALSLRPEIGRLLETLAGNASAGETSAGGTLAGGTLAGGMSAGEMLVGRTSAAGMGMTGSGSAVFRLFDDRRAAEECAARVRAEESEAFVAVTETLSRDDVARRREIF